MSFEPCSFLSLYPVVVVSWKPRESCTYQNESHACHPSNAWIWGCNHPVTVLDSMKRISKQIPINWINLPFHGQLKFKRSQIPKDAHCHSVYPSQTQIAVTATSVHPSSSSIEDVGLQKPPLTNKSLLTRARQTRCLSRTHRPPQSYTLTNPPNSQEQHHKPSNRQCAKASRRQVCRTTDKRLRLRRRDRQARARRHSSTGHSAV